MFCGIHFVEEGIKTHGQSDSQCNREFYMGNRGCTCNQSKPFVEYYLKMMAYTKIYKAISNGVRQNTRGFRSWDKVANLLIAFPEYEEQEENSDCLDSLVPSVNSIIEGYERQIEQLYEMKHRIIADTVTGQIGVRGIEIPEYEFEEEW